MDDQHDDGALSPATPEQGAELSARRAKLARRYDGSGAVLRWAWFWTLVWWGIAFLVLTTDHGGFLNAASVVIASLSTVNALGKIRERGELRRKLRAVDRELSSPAPVALPTAVPDSSRARPALDRLTERALVLDRLAGLLGESGASAAAEAAASAEVLRGLAGRIAVVEAAAAGADPAGADSLERVLEELRTDLERGVSAYDTLVQAAAHAVAAGAGSAEDVAARRRLDEAAAELTGLAAGLREVRQLSAPPDLAG